MYTFILACKEFRELLLIDLEQVAEALPNVPIERQVGTILHATLDDHAAKFDLLTGADLQLQEFVATLIELDSRHNNEVYSLSELH